MKPDLIFKFLNKNEIDKFKNYIYNLSSLLTLFNEYELYYNEKPLSKASPHLI